jgi:H+/Cl- antiporter ClcA
MSPAEGTTKGYQKAAQKMGAVGNETKWPRDDNFYMGK